MKTLMQSLHSSAFAKFALKIVITALVFWLVFRGVDFAGLQEVLRHQNQAILLVGAALLFLQMAIGSLRWQVILDALLDKAEQGLSTFVAFKIYYISTFFMCCLPGAVGGDVVRVWLTKSEHVSLPVSINSVVIDRVMALVALILMVMATMPVLGNAVGFNAKIILPVMIALAMIGVIFVFKAEKILAPVKHLRVVNWTLHLVSGIRLMLERPRISFLALLMAIIGQLIYSVAAWALAQSLSIDMTLMQSITLMPPVMLATMLPISIGGWGVREMGVVGMLGIIGISRDSALVLSLQLGLLGVLISLPGSLFWLSHRKNYAQRITQHS